MFKILDLEKEAEDEVYAFIEKNLRKLPKNKGWNQQFGIV